jgi:hypothetical protein
MKFKDIPDAAWSAEPTPIPTKTVAVYDWNALREVLETQGFVVIESDEVRTLTSGAEESVLVKMFNSYMRQTAKKKLFTRRLSTTRWICTLKGELTNVR